MSKIEWTGDTCNPVVGCKKVSPGCANCYAETLACRLACMGQQQYADVTVAQTGRWSGTVQLLPRELLKPLRRKKPQTYFMCSMSDLFHQDVPCEFIAAIFGVMSASPQHTFQILTKRPASMLAFFTWMQLASSRDFAGCVADVAWEHTRRALPGINLDGRRDTRWPLPNVHIGVSAEDQQRADERIPRLWQCPAAVRFMSYEPALGPVDLRRTWKWLDWVIAGGESGPGARPAHPDWFRSLRDQCVSAGVAFFFKQWGAWAPLGPDRARRVAVARDGRRTKGMGRRDFPAAAESADGWTVMYRVGKKVAGRELDGRTWDELP